MQNEVQATPTMSPFSFNVWSVSLEWVLAAPRVGMY